MKLNSLFRLKLPALLAAMLATACSHTYRLGQSGPAELPWRYAASCRARKRSCISSIPTGWSIWCDRRR